MKILVTGAGGPSAVCAIKDMRNKHEVVAVDTDELASGLYLAKKSYIGPRADDPRFVEKILEIALKENVSAIIPNPSEELIHFAKNVDKFKEKGITVVVSNPKSVEISNDKLLSYKFFEGEKYCPKIYSKDNVVFPCVVKPRSSRGSRGFHVCDSREELESALEKNKKFGENVIVEFLHGPEYSTYGLSDLNGKPIFCFANKRLFAVGESKKAKIENDKEIIETAKEMASKLGLVGPWNIQIFKTENGPKLVEINPRFAGTMSLIIAAGVDFVGLTLKVFMGEKIDANKIKCDDGLLMTRYNEEIFINKDNLAKPFR